MTQLIDRRLNGKNKSAINRQRFINRYKTQIKHAISHALSQRRITDIDKGEEVNLTQNDILEPRLQHASSGIQQTVFSGNQHFNQGDRIERPPTQAAKTDSQASNTGEGEDDFIFTISRDEFLDLYFEDMALPDLLQKQFKQITRHKPVRSGFTTTGVPTNINVIRSMQQAKGRKIALRGSYQKKCDEKEVLLRMGNLSNAQIEQLKKEIDALKSKINDLPFIDEIDIRYNNRVVQERPSTQAVMFCLMDVSGSMDEQKKDIAKRFFILLYLFLSRSYEKIKLIFIRHHTSAKSVTEDDFFYSRETGGTVVSSALELTRDLIRNEYPESDWNIYIAQASDGDNWNADSPICQQLLTQDIMPFVQYYAYVEIMPRHHQSLWDAYLNIAASHENFAMQSIAVISDIYPVFRELFKRRCHEKM